MSSDFYCIMDAPQPVNYGELTYTAYPFVWKPWRSDAEHAKSVERAKARFTKLRPHILVVGGFQEGNDVIWLPTAGHWETYEKRPGQWVGTLIQTPTGWAVEGRHV